MAHKDLYEILGVKRTATPAEMKQAYRRLALKYHPDRAGSETDEKKFKELSAAYQILSDPKKRAEYDQFGQVGQGRAHQGFGGFGMEFDLSDLFGMGQRSQGFGDLFEDLVGQAFSQIQIEVPVKLTDLLLGGKVEIRTQMNEPITLDIPPGTPPGTAFRFQGKGTAHRRGRGDLIVIVGLQFPRQITREQQQALGELKKTGL